MGALVLFKSFQCRQSLGVCFESFRFLRCSDAFIGSRLLTPNGMVGGTGHDLTSHSSSNHQQQMLHSGLDGIYRDQPPQLVPEFTPEIENLYNL